MKILLEKNPLKKLKKCVYFIDIGPNDVVAIVSAIKPTLTTLNFEFIVILPFFIFFEMYQTKFTLKIFVVKIYLLVYVV